MYNPHILQKADACLPESPCDLLRLRGQNVGIFNAATVEATQGLESQLLSLNDSCSFLLHQG